jgi:hypothetical protein
MLYGQKKGEIGRPKSEERNMRQPIEPALEAPIATEPSFAVKEGTEHQPRKESGQHAQPGGYQIEVGGQCVDGRIHAPEATEGEQPFVNR